MKLRLGPSSTKSNLRQVHTVIEHFSAQTVFTDLPTATWIWKLAMALLKILLMSRVSVQKQVDANGLFHRLNMNAFKQQIHLTIFAQSVIFNGLETLEMLPEVIFINLALFRSYHTFLFIL